MDVRRLWPPEHGPARGSAVGLDLSGSQPLDGGALLPRRPATAVVETARRRWERVVHERLPILPEVRTGQVRSTAGYCQVRCVTPLGVTGRSTEMPQLRYIVT